MHLLITGSTGFVGQHVLKSLATRQVETVPFTVSILERSDVDLLSRDASHQIVERIQPTHVLHLAWANTSGAKYDLGSSHSNWTDATFSIIRDLSHLGIVNWGIGTGLELEGQVTGLSPYGKAKLDLKKSVIELNDPLCRWISMPYVFSIFHKRPRVMLSCLQSEVLESPNVRHDYLEIRDVAYQLIHIVSTNDSITSSVSSGNQISNIELCSKVLEKAKHELFESCSCVENNNVTRNESLSFFTAALLS